MNRWEKMESADDGLTGGLFEDENLAFIHCGWNGKAYVDAREREDFELAHKMLRDWNDLNIKRPIRSRDDYFDWVRDNQPKEWNSADPLLIENYDGHEVKKYAVSADLLSLVADNLGLDQESYADLKFYTARGTPLDTLHGVDGFLDFAGTVFTLDYTIRPEKKEAKADYIIKSEHLSSPEKVKETALEIANRMKRRLKVEEVRNGMNA